MSTIRQRTVLITGGASGIGLLLAHKMFREGAEQVIIWDLNEAALEEAIAVWRSRRLLAHGYVVNVADPDDVRTNAARTLSEHGPVDILVNNAGVVTGKEFRDHTHEEIDRTLDVNVRGVMHVSRAFLPEMIRQRRGHLVNISSASALVPVPRMSVYAGSKWAVLGWSESLRLELEDEPGELRVTTVTPGYINTGMFEGAEPPLLTPLLDPDDITERIVRAIRRNQIILRAPESVYLLPALRGLLPTRWFDRVVGEGLRVYDSMASFTGRIPRVETSRRHQETPIE